MENQGQKVKLIFFDEFSCSTRPNTSYAWAIRNTKPKVKSNERNRFRLNGLMSIDITTGKEYLKLTKQAKTDDIVDYFYNLAIDTIKEGCDQLWIILDNNSTHKDKMKEKLKQKLNQLYKTSNIEKPTKIYFDHTPPYSPDYNLAEYIIRLIRQTLLHHLPLDTTLQDIEQRLSTYFKHNQLQTPKQIQSTIDHILRLGVGRE